MCGKKEPESKSSEEMPKHDGVVTINDDERWVESCKKEGEAQAFLQGQFLGQKKWSKKMVKVLRGLEDSAPLLKRFSLCRHDFI